MSRSLRSRKGVAHWINAVRLGLGVASLVSVLTLGAVNLAGPAVEAATELDFYHAWAGKDAQVLQAVVDNFNRSHPQIKIRLIPNANLDKQLVALASGAIDIGYVGWNSVPSLVEKGAALPLDSFFSQPSAKLHPADFIPAALELGQINGRQYGLPMTVDIKMMFYNMDILDQLGLPIPETANQFEAMQKRALLKDGQGKITRLGFLPEYPWLSVGLWELVFGGRYYDAAKKQVTPDDPRNILGIRFMTFPYQTFGYEAVRAFQQSWGGYWTNTDPFVTERLVSTADGEWLPLMLRDLASHMRYQITPLPYPDDRPDLKYGSLIEPGMLFIASGTKHAQEAWEFVQYLDSAEQTVQICAAKGSLPHLRTVLDDARLWTGTAPGMKEFVWYLHSPNMHTFPNLTITSKYMSAIWTELQAVFAGKQTPEAAMQKVKEQIQPLLR
ncbi:MAG: extracellular solute-binding protein [Limnochordaceae bacterium]|nr:extracellular solute-binding protein [Limnochordaceae bacterium]